MKRVSGLTGKTICVALSGRTIYISPIVSCFFGSTTRGTEKFIVKDFQKAFPGAVKDAKVGFMSPDPKAMENPSYRQVCYGLLAFFSTDDDTTSSSTTTIRLVLTLI